MRSGYWDNMMAFQMDILLKCIFATNIKIFSHEIHNISIVGMYLSSTKYVENAEYNFPLANV